MLTCLVWTGNIIQLSGTLNYERSYEHWFAKIRPHPHQSGKRYSIWSDHQIENYHFVHHAIPEINLIDVDTL
jgi:hypothetical protein